MAAWLMSHGISHREWTDPKLTVILKIRHASMKRLEKRLLPVSKDRRVPGPELCEACISRSASLTPFLAPPSGPGQYKRETRGCSARKEQILRALDCERSTRSAMVFMPRSMSHDSKGAMAVPSAFCRNATRSASDSSLRQTSPPIQSACPEKCLVALWTTTSAPRSNGRMRRGHIADASTERSTPVGRSAADRRLKSQMRMSGFEGVST
mmetsp:Transcript_2189/g.6194  ORF Transcript_2189/g.6194 Transcript_2189/m.6194 type:complete len:210 (+) Transcript_2189:247-876(+)